MNELQIFKNDQFGEVRVADKNGEPLFCLSDLCKALNLSNPTMVANKLDDEDKPKLDLGLRNGQQATFVTEAGMYTVILRSDSPLAKPMQKWVTSEVLPSIRKNGAYMTEQTLEKALTSPDFLIQLATNLKEEKGKRIIAEEKIKKDAPKVLFADAITASERSCLIGSLAKVLKQNGVEIGQNRLFQWLRDNGYLCKSGERYNQPTQSAMDLGLFEVSYNTVVRSEKSFQTITTKVTGKGQIYFINKFLKAS